VPSPDKHLNIGSAGRSSLNRTVLLMARRRSGKEPEASPTTGKAHPPTAIETTPPTAVKSTPPTAAETTPPTAVETTPTAVEATPTAVETTPTVVQTTPPTTVATRHEENKPKRFRLLALDGGGVRGLSSLLILQHLMRMIDDQNPPKPCDVFDMIAGTSTGGFVAVSLV
jgi:hypothetical protein